MKKIFCSFILITCMFQNGYTQSAASSAGKVYYVDSHTGNDNSDGNSQGSAWQTIEKVNSITFQPGDRILFKAGSVWDNTVLQPKGSGVEGAPIIIDAYDDISDENNKPRINTNHLRVKDNHPNYANYGGVSAGLILKNASYWEINNLQITNDGNLPPNQRQGVMGVFLNSESYGVMEHIYIRNLYVHDIYGIVNKGGGHGNGIYALSSSNRQGRNNPNDTPSKFNDLRIENNHLERVMRNGIVTFANSFSNRIGRLSDMDKVPAPTDLYAVPFRSTNVIIRGNLLECIGGDGIIAGKTNGALLERNILRGGEMYDSTAPSAGIWTFDSDNCVIQYNVVSGMMGTADGQAFDIDYYTTNTLIQYNYSHDNAGGFLLLCSPGFTMSSTNVIRYNISQNDGSAWGWNRDWLSAGIFHVNGGNADTHIYNNTFYIGEHLHGFKVVATDQWEGGKPTNITFENNIFIVESENMYKFFSNNEKYRVQNYVPSFGTPDPNQFIWNNNAFIGKGFKPGTQFTNNMPAINQNSPLILTDDASNFFYGAGNAMFSLESAIAAYTPKPGTALTNYMGRTVAEPANLGVSYHLANGTPFNPGPQEWPYAVYQFYNYIPGIDFAGNPVNVDAPRQLGAILTNPVHPGLLPAPTVTVQTTAAGVEVNFTPVPGAEKYTLIYGKTHGFGYESRFITKTAAALSSGQFVLDLSGESHEFFDEYFFTVCAVDAGGKNGYFSFEKRAVVTNTVVDDHFDDALNPATRWNASSGDWEYKITADERKPISPVKWQTRESALNPDGSVTVNPGGDAQYYGAGWDDWTDYSVTATIKNEGNILGWIPSQSILLRQFEDSANRSRFYEVLFTRDRIGIHKVYRRPNNTDTISSQKMFIGFGMPENSRATVRVTATGSVITVEVEENGKFVRKVKYVDEENFSPCGVPALRTNHARATFSGIEISKILEGAGVYRQTNPSGGRSTISGLNVKYNSVETTVTINSMNDNGYAGFIAGELGVYLADARIFVKDTVSKSTVANAELPVLLDVPYTVTVEKKDSNLEVSVNNILVLTAPVAAQKMTGEFSLDMYNATAEYDDLTVKRQQVGDDPNPYYRHTTPTLGNAVEVPLIPVSR